MLLVIGILLLYIDIQVGSVDVVPDLIGYILLLPGLLTGRQRLALPLHLIILCTLSLVLEILNLIPGTDLMFNLLLYFLRPILNAVWMILLIRALRPAWMKGDALWSTRLSLANTCAVFTAICQIAGFPISWIRFGNAFLLLACAACGIYLAFIVFKLYRLDPA